MSALETLRAAARYGVQITLDGDDLIMEAAERPPAEVVASIKQNKAEIVTLLRAPALGHPAPRITPEPPFGRDGVPERYRAAWEALLAQRPPAVDPFAWWAAAFDAALLFGDWGGELARLGWTAGNLFDIAHDGKPGGLVWFIRGDPVVALGPEKAFTQSGRIFERRRQSP